MTQRQSWLKCKVHKGMFSDELAVAVDTLSGDASFFVPRDDVMGSVGQEGRVRVHVFEEGGATWAALPGGADAVVAIRTVDLDR